MRATRHNGRGGKEGVFKAKHNDRTFDVDNADHIDNERVDQNIYWDCYQGFNFANADGQRPERKMNFEEVEKAFYNEKFFISVLEQNDRHEKARHPERCRTVEDILKNKKTCPEETIYQLGTVDGHADVKTFCSVVTELLEEMQKRYGSNFQILDLALHMDEGTPHIHERHVSLISYIYLFAPEEEQNIGLLLDLIDASETSEEDEDFKNAVDLIFEEIEEEDPDNYALKEYKKFKLAAGKTMKSILISCAARLAPFDIPRIREITSYDEMGLDKIGEERTALFVIISDTDSTFNFLVSIMYAQLFDLLCDKALKVYHGELPIHVRFILDEFANIGKIPDFQKKISVIRSRNISASIILQSKSQLKAIYKDDMTTIIDNCDSYLFLGGSGKETLKDLEEMLGKETIDTMSTSMTKGTNESHSVNYNVTGHTLKSQDEIFVMPRTKCILMLSGVNPFLSDKYDITQHKRYPMLSDYDKKNAFDVYRYVHTYRKAKLKPTTEVTVIEA